MILQVEVEIEPAVFEKIRKILVTKCDDLKLKDAESTSSTSKQCQKALTSFRQLKEGLQIKLEHMSKILEAEANRTNKAEVFEIKQLQSANEKEAQRLKNQLEHTAR